MWIPGVSKVFSYIREKRHPTVSPSRESTSGRAGASLSPSPNPTAAPSQKAGGEKLLLGGDEFYVTRDGIARSFYQLVPANSDEHPPIAIEEVYALTTAHKRFLLRQETPVPKLPSSMPPSSHKPLQLRKPVDNVAPLGITLASLEVGEIQHGVEDQTVGTGATTWEASIAMALYFSTHPEELKGNVIELGSGVGSGGILYAIGPRWNENFKMGAVSSITLTDGNDSVLRQCRHNVVDAFGFFPVNPQVNVCKLDWNGFLSSDVFGRYDTVIACDCVYRQEDPPVLAEVMNKLLEVGPTAKIHLFSPHNRAHLDDIKTCLRKLDLKVTAEPVEIVRYRLRPGVRQGFHASHTAAKRDPTLQECSYVSKVAAQFVHITATRSDNESRQLKKLSSLD